MKEKLIKKYCKGVPCIYYAEKEGNKPFCLYFAVMPYDPLYTRGGAELSAIMKCPRGGVKAQRRLSHRVLISRLKKALCEFVRKHAALLHDLRIGVISGIVAALVFIVFELVK